MKMKVSDYLADFMADRGVTRVFTVTGGGAMHLNDSLGNHARLRCTYNHHEQASAIAAEGYARLSGRPALVCVTSGPGGTNALTGVMGAWVDSIPMLVVSGQVKYSTTISSTDLPLRQLGDQEFDIVDVAGHMTKYAVMVSDPEKIAYHLERAFALATGGRPGPVWLDIPLNVQGAMIDPGSLVHYDPASTADAGAAEDSAILPPSVPDGTLEALLEKIRAAKRPVILGGGGIRTSGAHGAFLELLESLRIPVTTAWNAHDLLPDSHPLFSGRPGTVGTRGGNFVVQGADLVVSLGCRMNIRQISYNWENFAKDAFLAAVDVDAAELRKPTLSVDMPINADLADFLPRLAALARARPVDAHPSWLSWCKAINAKYPACGPRHLEKDSPVNPYAFFSLFSARLREGDVTVAGNGSACVCSFQAMTVKDGQRLFTNSGCASMGYGLPAAIGAAVSRGGARVICLEGDGSVQMNIQELQTVVHNRLNLKIVWLNNDGYHSIRQTQKNLFDSRFCGVSAASGISFPDAERIATAYGIPFFRVDSLSTLESRVDAFLGGDGPALCEVVLDPAQGFEPKLAARALPDGTMVSPPLDDMFPFLGEDEMRENRYRGE